MIRTSERILDALSFISADDRDVWVRMAMSVKSELGDEGFELWDRWSQQDRSYNGNDARTVWKSLEVGGKVTIRSLYHLARQSGWHGGESPQSSISAETCARREFPRAGTSGYAEGSPARKATAEAARALASAARPVAADHPYLVRKQIKPVTELLELKAEEIAAILGYVPKANGEPLAGRIIIAPVQIDGSLSTVELIDSNGRKVALPGRGSKTGGFWAAQQNLSSDGAGKTLLVGEGIATVLSAREATGNPAYAALSNTNLLNVTEALSRQNPAANLIILADLEKSTGAPDQRAIEAARVCKARIAVPDFGSTRQAAETDFNDLFCSRGSPAVARAVEVARQIVDHQSGRQGGSKVELLRASSIQPEPIDWLWKDYLGAGKLAILGGAPGTGKTTMALQFASTVSTGGCWPDGTRAEQGAVVIWSGEDGRADTLVPRLVAAGSNLDQIHFVHDVIDGEERRPFDPARDIQALTRELALLGNVRLLIIDPIVSAISGDSHKNAEVRRSLQPLVDAASAANCAIVGITHLSKGTSGRDPIDRLTGSLAFGALARTVHIVVKLEGDTEHVLDRLFVRAKSNIGPDGDGFEYEVSEIQLMGHPDIIASRVIWGSQVYGSAKSLLTKAEASEAEPGEGRLAEARQFLQEKLASGPVKQAEIIRNSVAAGFAEKTLRRAFKTLGGLSTKLGMKDGWIWELPRSRPSKTEDGRTDP